MRFGTTADLLILVNQLVKILLCWMFFALMFALQSAYANQDTSEMSIEIVFPKKNAQVETRFQSFESFKTYFFLAKCGLNEIYLQCGSPCEATCDIPNNPLLCKAACRPGCFCRPGFLRNVSRVCVKSTLCPRKLTPISEV
jgi:Trypsin Inhibitor like cysteine rich domain